MRRSTWTIPAARATLVALAVLPACDAVAPSAPAPVGAVVAPWGMVSAATFLLVGGVRDVRRLGFVFFDANGDVLSDEVVATIPLTVAVAGEGWTVRGTEVRASGQPSTAVVTVSVSGGASASVPVFAVARLELAGGAATWACRDEGVGRMRIDSVRYAGDPNATIHRAGLATVYASGTVVPPDAGVEPRRRELVVIAQYADSLVYGVPMPYPVGEPGLIPRHPNGGSLQLRRAVRDPAGPGGRYVGPSGCAGHGRESVATEPLVLAAP